MKRFGKELEFISCVNSDGKSVHILNENLRGLFDDYEFKLIRLSIDKQTFIAFENLNIYVVKLKCDL